MITKQRLLSYFKGGRLMVAEHEGGLYVTDSYLIFGFDSKKSVMAELLADYNLKAEPMVCEVGPTIRLREGQTPPDMAKFLTPPTKKTHKPATPQTIGGFSVLLRHQSCLGEVWETAGGLRLMIDQAKRQVIDDLVPRGKWMAESDIKPMVKVDDADKVLALVMPVRTLFDTAAKAA